ncbi:uncharacterized protein N0V89_011188 [Didymosphaeria variabile]|uniref:High-affinity methionine permease n=1 Tax=Didymosphaeria variabile TaxID=1932322 RepID=A0A9W8XD72_9PLEO|nr:uncharacterized protein N0V89_011188 [Didymosphaeria variabile]KAJ4347248.1 hypothetical protein N0V89_011188 [Didymosphaeria variabile]
MIVVPKAEQIAGNVALAFFQRTLGSVSQDESQPRRILAAFMAVSSFGNIVVMTFTAARVKQEIAKEGILPWAKFFGQSKNLSFGRFLAWAQKDQDSVIARKFHWLLKRSWMDPREHSQETPFGALFLHWSFTVLMIVVTSHLKPTDAYTLLVDLYTYTIVSIFGFIIAVGMLRLRFSSTKRWSTKSPFRPAFSILSAFAFALGSCYPIVASWVPPSSAYLSKTQLAVAWFTTPVVAWSVLGLGMFWYQAFKLYAWRRAHKGGVEFQVQKVPEFDRDPPPNGPPVQVHETVFLAWVAKENESMDLDIEDRRSMESF